LNGANVSKPRPRTGRLHDRPLWATRWAAAQTAETGETLAAQAMQDVRRIRSHRRQDRRQFRLLLREAEMSTFGRRSDAEWYLQRAKQCRAAGLELNAARFEKLAKRTIQILKDETNEPPGVRSADGSGGLNFDKR
jgi:hypothetical protein